MDPADAPEQATRVMRRPWGEYAQAWTRAVQGWMVAAILAAIGFILALVGFLLVISAGEQDENVFNGPTLGGLGLLLVVLAVVAVAASAPHPLFSVQLPVAVGIAAGLATLALVFALVGLIQAHSDDFGAFEATEGWLPFSFALAFLALGWLLAARPLPRAYARLATVAGGSLAFVFGIVGLAVGLGDDFNGYLEGSAWLSFASIWALLALAAALGRESADLPK